MTREKAILALCFMPLLAGLSGCTYERHCEGDELVSYDEKGPLDDMIEVRYSCHTQGAVCIENDGHAGCAIEPLQLCTRDRCSADRTRLLVCNRQTGYLSAELDCSQTLGTESVCRQGETTADCLPYPVESCVEDHCEGKLLVMCNEELGYVSYKSYCQGKCEDFGDLAGCMD